MNEKLNIAAFLAGFAVLFIFVILIPSDQKASEYENRSMAAKPSLSIGSLLDGSFFEGLEAYLSDSAGFRTSILQFAADAERNYGVRLPGDAILVEISGDDLGQGLIPDEDDENLYIAAPETDGADAFAAPGESPPQGGPADADDDEDQSSAPQPSPDDPSAQDDTTTGAALPSEPPSPPPPPPPPRVDTSAPFSVDVNYDQDAILYERYRENSRAVRRYAEILNSYMSRIPENVRVFSMLAPIRVEFMGDRYATSNDSQRATIDKINELLDERIIRTATYEAMAAHYDEYIYFRTDHHWTALGAYYAYLSFAEAAGLSPIYINSYVEQSIPGFLGSFGRGTSNRTVRNHPDTLYYYSLDDGTTFSRRLFVIPSDLSRLSYRVFMGGDYAKLDFTSSNHNGKTLVVVKDSYANALIPWLAPHYERIIVIDPRQFNGSVSRILRELDSADLLFMDYVAAASMSDFIETIYGVR